MLTVCGVKSAVGGGAAAGAFAIMVRCTMGTGTMAWFTSTEA